MGVVYRATDVRLGRPVALKLLSDELSRDESFRARFERESRLAAAIDHAHIVPVYEAGSAGGLLFLAMRYVDGGDLAEVLRGEGRLEPGRALALVGQLAERVGRRPRARPHPPRRQAQQRADRSRERA